MKQRWRLFGQCLFRLIVVGCVALAISGLFNVYYGLGFVIVALLIEVCVHVISGVRMLEWLTGADVTRIPMDQSELWRKVFDRMYENRKALITNTRRLEEREARYLKTLSAIPEGIVLVKNDWVLSWWNPRAEELFGLRGERHVGRHLLAVIDDHALINYVRGEQYDAPLIWQRPGSNQRIEIRIVVADANNALIVARDVTEQERLHATRRDFVANVSHELRTPLTVLSGFIEMARQGAEINAHIKPQHLDLMRDQAERMQRLVDDLLTLSRLEMSENTQEPERIAMDELVSSILSEMRIVDKGMHSLSGELTPATLVGFKDEIRSAVQNLMTNAVRYTPEGGSVIVSCRTNADGTVQVSVKDNGIGIKEEDIPRLTERFYRVDKSRSRATGGTGLGLAIVKHVLMHHKGQLQIESEAGKGSCFTLRFPGADTNASNR